MHWVHYYPSALPHKTPIMPIRNQCAKNWCFTLNNYAQEDVARLSGLVEEIDACVYLVFGRELAPQTQTPHLQGFVSFSSRLSGPTVRAYFPRCHVEVARGTPLQASEYCKKDGDYEEFGVLPRGQGARNDWDRLKRWVVEELQRRPTLRELAATFPGLFHRGNTANLWIIIDSWLPEPSFIEGEPREGWQRDLFETLLEDADPREIVFFSDAEGNKGKTWLCQYMLSKYPERVQYLGIAKRDDLCFMIDPSKDIFLLDVPRQQMEYLQYPVLEMLKNRLVVSPKYGSTVKQLTKVPHVVVFANEYPNMDAMSNDRYIVNEI